MSQVLRVLVVSCARDAWILYYCVRAVRKYVGSVRAVRLVVVTDDVAEVRKVCPPDVEVRFTPDVLPVVVDNIALPYHRQQGVKLLADQLFPGEGPIVVLDSDMIFEERIRGGYSRAWRWTPVEKMHPGDRRIWELNWLTCEEAVFGDRSGLCFMPPKCGSGWLVKPEGLRRFRDMVYARHGKHVTQLIQSVGGNNAQHFSEWHLLGRWLYENHPEHTRQVFDPTDRAFPEVWTYSGRADRTLEVRNRLEAAIKDWDE